MITFEFEAEDNLPYIGNKDQADDFQKIRSCVETGYRINFSTFELAKRTFFMLHNETVNVWTHGLGAIYFIVMFLFSVYLSFRKMPYSSVPIWPLIVHAVAAFLQMALSAYFHQFNCQCSKKFFYL